MAEYNPSEISIQNRKLAKTCVEKKRRDRINKCLEELKEIMVQSSDKARYQKLEKAEILEMAVNYMKSLKNTSNNSVLSQIINFNDENAAIKLNYITLFQQYLSDFQIYIKDCSEIDENLKLRIVNFMNQRYSKLELPIDNTYNSENQEIFNFNENNCPSSCKSNLRFSPYKKFDSKYINNQTEIHGNKSKKFKSEKVTPDRIAEQARNVTETNLKNYFSYYEDDSNNYCRSSIFTSICLKSTKEIPKTFWRPW